MREGPLSGSSIHPHSTTNDDVKDKEMVSFAILLGRTWYRTILLMVPEFCAAINEPISGLNHEVTYFRYRQNSEPICT